MKLIDILFPILKTFEDIQKTDLDEISENNYELSQELKDKPAMSAQEIVDYVKNKK
jgi:hypothetical protein